MKSLSILLFLFAQIPFARLDAVDSTVSVAILDFESSSHDLQRTGPEFALLLGAELESSPNLMIVERQILEKALDEQALGLSGIVTSDTGSRIGQLTGVKVIVSGRLVRAGNKISAVAKLIGTETGRVFSAKTTFTADNPAAGASDLAATIVRVIAANREALLAAPTMADDQAVKELETLVAGRDLPQLFIKIPEEHVGRRVPDPATETEIARIAGDLGFRLVTSPTASSEVIRIEGEAFSEFAGRFGGLVSCKARVEVKVIDPKTGAILLADRETTTAVDTAENIAGKKALQEGGRSLAPRIIRAILNR